jgi:hypothetical protein
MQMQEETRACPSKRHISSNHHPPFPYENTPLPPKEATPLKFFRKDPENPHSKLLVTCWFCRQADKPHMKKYAEKHKEAANQQNMLVDQGVTKLGYCPCKNHDGASKSKFPRNAVPMENFRMRFGDRTSQLTDHCIDCRNYHAKLQLEWTTKKRHDASLEGKHLCRGCNKDITDSRVLNVDGTLSAQCKECKDRQRIIRREAKAHYKKIIMDRIKKHEVSCLRCEKLYFSPLTPESYVVQEFDTYVRDGTRYCVMNNLEYRVCDILAKCESMIELQVVELDHLPMKDQLARGIIKHESEFAPKRHAVSRMRNIGDMDFEAVGCQHLCCKCHLIVTIERQVGSRKLSELGKIKMSHVHLRKFFGCVSCGYHNVHLPRFFDMDHVNTKIASISEMVYDDNVSFKQFVEECDKCRVLCKFCHRIRTRLQRQAGIVSLKQKPAPTSQS